MSGKFPTEGQRNDAWRDIYSENGKCVSFSLKKKGKYEECFKSKTKLCVSVIGPEENCPPWNKYAKDLSPEKVK